MFFTNLFTKKVKKTKPIKEVVLAQLPEKYSQEYFQQFQNELNALCLKYEITLFASLNVQPNSK